jgi:hypothetical protein
MFTTISNGEPTDAGQVNQFIQPILDLQAGAAYYCGTTSGTAMAYTASLTPAPLALSPGQVATFIPHIGNPGAATLNLNGLGAVAILYRGAALVGGEFTAGIVAMAIYAATGWSLCT